MLINTNVLSHQENKLYKARKERTFLHKSGVKELIVLIFILCDTVCMYQSIDLFFSQKAWISFMITFALAFVLDVPMMVVGACIHDRRTDPGIKKLEIGGLLSAFVMIYLCTFSLRFATMDEMFPVTSLEIAGQVAEQTQTGHTVGQYIMSLILAVIPLCTSGVSFVLGMQDDPDEKYRHQLRLNRIELRQQADMMRVQYAELSEDMSFDLNKYDEARYGICLETIENQANILKSDSKKYLAEKLAKAEAVSELMEEPEQPRKEKPSGHINHLNLTA